METPVIPAEPAPRGSVPRVAFFADSFHESNGVALTSRQFAAFARQHFYPFFSVHAGPQTAYWKRGNFETYELAHGRSLLSLEHDLSFDLGFLRHRSSLRAALAAFRPDLIHVTGPSHLGMLGALLAHDLGIPLVASWHTNVHEYSSRRISKVLRKLPAWSRQGWEAPVANLAQDASLYLALRFYKLAKLLFAPNPELVAMLAQRTGKPVHLMQRGVDAELFQPCKRTQAARPYTIGYVGRLSAEKNVRIFAEVDSCLRNQGIASHRFLIVGEGSERAWLQDHLPDSDFPGLLHGEALAAAYANMDVFLFPSETDTFGNVILEAMASGVPAVVSAHGGPKHMVSSGQNGFVATDSGSKAEAFGLPLAQLFRDPAMRARMAQTARQSALLRQWSAVFETIYSQYQAAFREGVLLKPTPPLTGPVSRPRLQHRPLSS